MTTTALTRVLRTEVLTGTVPGLRAWLVRAGCFGLCLVATLFLVAVRLQAIRLRYEINELVREKQAAAARLSNLEVERSALGASNRLEREARRLGFVVPGRDAVVVLSE